MNDKCPKCNGSKRILKLVFFCPNKIVIDPTKSTTLVKCDKELYAEKETDSKTGNRDDNIVELKCSCGFTYSGKVGDIEYEEVVSLCDCSKDMFIKKLALEEQLIQGHFPKDLWKRELIDYQSISAFWKRESNKKVILDINSFIKKPELLSVYNFYWIRGETQSGTSSIAVAFAKGLFTLNKRAFFISMHKLIEKFKDFDDKGFMEELLSYDVIVLDDAFSSERYFIKSDFAKVHVYNFFKELLSLDKILICASNCRISEIDDKSYESIKQLLTANSYTLDIEGNLIQDISDKKKEDLESIRGSK